MAVEIHRAMQDSEHVYSLPRFPVEDCVPPDIVTLKCGSRLGHMGASQKREIGGDLNSPANFPCIFTRLPLTVMPRRVAGYFFNIGVRFC